MTTITTGTLVTLEDETTAFVRRVDEKSQRAVLVFTTPEAPGFEAMRRLTTLTPVKAANGRVRKVKDVQAAIQAARAGQPV